MVSQSDNGLEDSSHGFGKSKDSPVSDELIVLFVYAFHEGLAPVTMAVIGNIMWKGFSAHEAKRNHTLRGTHQSQSYSYLVLTLFFRVIVKAFV